MTRRNIQIRFVFNAEEADDLNELRELESEIVGKRLSKRYCTAKSIRLAIKAAKRKKKC